MTSPADASVLRRIAERVDGATSVARRSGGIAGTVSSYLPGERILGVRATADGRLDIHVVMSWGSTVDEVEHDVIAAVGTDWPTGTVDITVDDIDFADASTPHLPAEPSDAQRSFVDAAAAAEPSPAAHVPTM